MCGLSSIAVLFVLSAAGFAQPTTTATRPIILHAARLLDVETGRMLTPAKYWCGRSNRGGRLGCHAPGWRKSYRFGQFHPVARLHRRARAFVSASWRGGSSDRPGIGPAATIVATLGARDDLMAGFTAERDMGTEGAGAADTAVRDAIDQGQIPGPRLRISGNAVDVLGGHEDACTSILNNMCFRTPRSRTTPPSW